MVTISEALAALDKYQIPIPGPASDIWTLVLRHAPSYPIQAYALAAHHDMESICIETSRYTCAVSLETITEADALTMGSMFLRKLFFLHLGRCEALKRVTEAPPKPHREVRNCREDAHASIVRAWALVVANILVQPMLQNIQVAQLREMFAGTMQGRTCGPCIDSIRSRVVEICDEWSAVKSTI
ncbi:hypothetical protein FRB96_006754 [Tulasnella sp. 330]|nr:hypothetical protein FRB96_006754 [Tulasnella sp. 330]KAG8878937.1 hypothetical protein FRB97_002083 [Tulasnella sp. 331]